LRTDYLPEGNVLIRRLNDIKVDTFGLCLFDSGSTTTLMNQRALPRIVKPRVGSVQQYTTTQGTYRAQNYVLAEEILFPDFCKSRIIPSIKIRLFDSPTSRYDVIIGRDVLSNGFVLDHAKNTIAWDGLSVPMTPITPNVPTPPVATYLIISTNKTCIYEYI